MKSVYYYIRDSKLTKKEAEKIKKLGKNPFEIKVTPHPRVTICLMKSNYDGTIARGVSICSLRDNPNKKTGREYAEYNALWAMKHEEIGREIKRQEAMEALEKTSHFGCYHKAFYNATPINELEEKLFKALRRNDERS